MSALDEELAIHYSAITNCEVERDTAVSMWFLPVRAELSDAHATQPRRIHGFGPLTALKALVRVAGIVARSGAKIYFCRTSSITRLPRRRPQRSDNESGSSAKRHRYK